MALEHIWIRKVENSDKCCLFVHGRAGNFNVMSAFKSLIPDDTSIVSVQAPLETLPEDNPNKNGRPAFSWWSGNVRQQASEEQMAEINDSLSLLEEFCFNCQPKPLTAAGFSQGAAMLSLFIQKHPDFFKSCALLAGFVLTFSEGMDKQPQTEILMTHGRNDDIVAVEWARVGCNQLKEKGFNVNFIETDAGHKVGASAMTALKGWFTTG